MFVRWFGLGVCLPLYLLVCLYACLLVALFTCRFFVRLSVCLSINQFGSYSVVVLLVSYFIRCFVRLLVRLSYCSGVDTCGANPSPNLSTLVLPASAAAAVSSRSDIAGAAGFVKGG